MNKKFHSKDIEYLYDDTYFLGGKSKHTGQFIGVEGYKEFSEGKIYQKKIDYANMVNFKNKIVLDVGFGRGEVLKYCYNNGAKSCIGTDYSKSAFNIARKYLPTNIRLYNKAIDEIEKIEENNIEIIYMLDILEHIPNEEL